MCRHNVRIMKASQGDIAVHDWSNENPRYLALLVHGYGEHLGRYHSMATVLTEHGAKVFGPDHLGHGLSQGEPVLIDDYDAVVDDVHLVVEHFRQLYPNQRLIIIGHSMGGMIATRYSQRYGKELSALVLSGPLIGHTTQITDLLDLPEIPDSPLDTSILSRDPQVGQDYLNDPLVWHGPFKRKTLQAIKTILHKINQGPAFGTLPILWIHGDNDRLVVMEESEITLNLLKGSDFEVLINPGGQHENFNEINKDEIISKVCAFIDRVL